MADTDALGLAGVVSVNPASSRLSNTANLRLVEHIEVKHPRRVKMDQTHRLPQRICGYRLLRRGGILGQFSLVTTALLARRLSTAQQSRRSLVRPVLQLPRRQAKAIIKVGHVGPSIMLLVLCL